jgi:hypothetical protein
MESTDGEDKLDRGEEELEVDIACGRARSEKNPTWMASLMRWTTSRHGRRRNINDKGRGRVEVKRVGRS